MTREQIKAMLPDGTEDAVVTKILDALHGEIQPHKDAAKKAQDDLAAKVAELAEVGKKAGTVDEKIKAYDALQAKYDADLKAANEKAAELEFGGMLDGLLREKGARSLKAAKALLDVAALKGSKNQQADAKAAVEALAKSEEGAFLFAPQPTGGTGGVGAPVGAPPAAKDGVESAFLARNPGLKIE